MRVMIQLFAVMIPLRFQLHLPHFTLTYGVTARVVNGEAVLNIGSQAIKLSDVVKVTSGQGTGQNNV